MKPCIQLTALVAAQRGATLIIALVMLVVMTLLGLSSVRSMTIEEKMAGNAYDRSLAFQAAEAALRFGEARADGQSKTTPANRDFSPDPNSGLLGAERGGYTDTDNNACGISPCATGLCNQPDVNCKVRWLDSSFTDWVDASGMSLGTLAGNAPQYFIEYLGRDFTCDPLNINACIGGTGVAGCNCRRYRITARSSPGAGRAQVMLQSIYLTN